MVGMVALVAVVLMSVRSAGSDPPRVLHGLASYYGPGFHGQETASGEIFDQWEMVAAHRTLPLGTRVRVTNLDNGRSVVLRVIDRGPYGRNFRRGTIIDVSKGAARRLRFLRGRSGAGAGRDPPAAQGPRSLIGPARRLQCQPAWLTSARQSSTR